MSGADFHPNGGSETPPTKLPESPSTTNQKEKKNEHLDKKDKKEQKNEKTQTHTSNMDEKTQKNDPSTSSSSAPQHENFSSKAFWSRFGSRGDNKVKRNLDMFNEAGVPQNLQNIFLSASKEKFFHGTTHYLPKYKDEQGDLVNFSFEKFTKIINSAIKLALKNLKPDTFDEEYATIEISEITDMKGLNKLDEKDKEIWLLAYALDTMYFFVNEGTQKLYPAFQTNAKYEEALLNELISKGLAWLESHTFLDENRPFILSPQHPSKRDALILIELLYNHDTHMAGINALEDLFKGIPFGIKAGTHALLEFDPSNNNSKAHFVIEVFSPQLPQLTKNGDVSYRILNFTKRCTFCQSTNHFKSECPLYCTRCQNKGHQTSKCRTKFPHKSKSSNYPQSEKSDEQPKPGFSSQSGSTQRSSSNKRRNTQNTWNTVPGKAFPSSQFESTASPSQNHQNSFELLSTDEDSDIEDAPADSHMEEPDHGTSNDSESNRQGINTKDFPEQLDPQQQAKKDKEDLKYLEEQIKKKKYLEDHRRVHANTPLSPSRNGRSLLKKGSSKIGKSLLSRSSSPKKLSSSQSFTSSTSTITNLNSSNISVNHLPETTRTSSSASLSTSEHSKLFGIASQEFFGSQEVESQPLQTPPNSQMEEPSDSHGNCSWEEITPIVQEASQEDTLPSASQLNEMTDAPLPAEDSQPKIREYQDDTQASATFTPELVEHLDKTITNHDLEPPINEASPESFK